MEFGFPLDGDMTKTSLDASDEPALCEKKEVIIEKLNELLKKLGGEVLAHL